MMPRREAKKSLDSWATQAFAATALTLTHPSLQSLDPLPLAKTSSYTAIATSDGAVWQHRDGCPVRSPSLQLDRLVVALVVAMFLGEAAAQDAIVRIFLLPSLEHVTEELVPPQAVTAEAVSHPCRRLAIASMADALVCPNL